MNNFLHSGAILLFIIDYSIDIAKEYTRGNNAGYIKKGSRLKVLLPCTNFTLTNNLQLYNDVMAVELTNLFLYLVVEL